MKDWKAQRGGFAMGLIVGLLIGLALALGVALYVTKAPNPFVNKVPQRSAVQDAAEAEHNRNWDPNAPLAGKTPARPASGVATGPATAPPSELPPALGAAVPTAAVPRSARASGPAGEREPVAIAVGRPAASSVRVSPPLSATAGSDPFTYFVQAGAYGRTEDAEQQRAKLAMLGIEARLTEREQAGRTVYRVRVGPFARKDDAEAAKGKLNDAGIDSALVRVQK